jgi:hypothetical protein
VQSGSWARQRELAQDAVLLKQALDHLLLARLTHPAITETQSSKIRAFMSGEGSSVLAHSERVAQFIEISAAYGPAAYRYRTGWQTARLLARWSPQELRSQRI